METQWECLCGFTTMYDGGAYNHYREAAGYGGGTRYTEMEMGAEGQLRVEPVTEMTLG
jgi:hypothetical protein